MIDLVKKVVVAALACVVVSTAQAQALIPTSKRNEVPPPKAVKDGNRKINFQLIDALLDPAIISGATRAAVRDSIVAALQKSGANLSTLRAALAPTNFSAAQLDYAVEVLNAMSTPAANESSQLLSSSTSTGTTDRLYGNVEVFRYQTRSFSLRMVTSVAVSDADLYEAEESTLSLAKRDSAAEYRTQTAQLLSTIQDGGPFAVHASQSWQKVLGENWTLQSGAILSVARSGIVHSGGSALYGFAGEFRLGARPAASRENQTPESISFLVRLGTRLSGEPLLTATSSHHISFAQLIVEGRPRGSRVPIGIAVSGIAEKALRPFGVKFQVFGTAGL